MKKLIISVLMMSMSIALLAQDGNKDEIKTLFGVDGVDGFYLGTTVSYSEIAGKDGMFIGGRLMWLNNRRFGIGFSAYGFFNELDYKENTILPLSDNFVSGGYGAFVIEPVIFSTFPVHLTAPIQLGVGGAAVSERVSSGEPYNYDYFDVVDIDAFFIVEPGIEVELNMSKHFRIALAVTYRFTLDQELINLKSNALDGLSLGATFKFGKF